MASRPVANGSISFGLVSIPVKLFSATRSRSVSFHLIHAKDNSRIQQRIYCPVDDAIVDRSELIRAFEIEKGKYVPFSNEELEKLEARENQAVEITEFVPLAQVDPIFFDNAYHLGCEPAAERAYKLLASVMNESKRVAIAHFTMRNKEHLVIIRPYEKGLMMHTMYYGDEIVEAADIDRGESAKVNDRELELAKRLVDDLTEKKFDPAKYHDTYRERVLEAAQNKAAGQEAVAAPAEEHRGKVIDLMAALKASLEKRGEGKGNARAEAEEEPAEQVRAASASGDRRPASRSRATASKARKRG